MFRKLFGHWDIYYRDLFLKMGVFGVPMSHIIYCIRFTGTPRDIVEKTAAADCRFSRDTSFFCNPSQPEGIQ